MPPNLVPEVVRLVTFKLSHPEGLASMLRSKRLWPTRGKNVAAVAVMAVPRKIDIGRVPVPSSGALTPKIVALQVIGHLDGRA